MRFPVSLRSSVVAASALLLFSFAAGCGKSIPTNAATGTASPPSTQYAPPGTFGVIAISPAPGATNVTATTVQITFSDALDLTTVGPTTIRITDPNSSAVTGSLAYGAGSTIVKFTITQSLAVGATYTVTVSGVKSAAGAAMAGTFTSTFSTPPPPPPVPPPVSDCPIGNGPDLRGFAVALPGCIQYQSQLESSPDFTASDGGIAMDTDGNMVIYLRGNSNGNPNAGPANSDFTVQFCPVYNSSYSANVPSCFEVGVVSSDSQGNLNSIIKFPRSGSWAGDFQLLVGNTVWFKTTQAPGYTTIAGFPFITLAETLQPESTVNGIGVTHGLEQDSLTLGAFSYDIHGDLYIYLNGASLDTYRVNEWSNLDLGCSCANLLGTFTTVTNPAQNHFSIKMGYGDIYTIEPQDGSHTGWIGGFSVP